jgi:hypothetical protein
MAISKPTLPDIVTGDRTVEADYFTATGCLLRLHPDLTPNKLKLCLSPKSPEVFSTSDRLVPKPEARKLLGGTSASTLDRMLRDGQLAKVMIRGRVMIPLSSINNILAGGE